MQGQTYEASKQRKDTSWLFQPLFKLDVFVPVWMRKIVQADALDTAFEKSDEIVLVASKASQRMGFEGR